MSSEPRYYRHVINDYCITLRRLKDEFILHSEVTDAMCQELGMTPLKSKDSIKKIIASLESYTEELGNMVEGNRGG